MRCAPPPLRLTCFALLFALPAFTETAVLECVADGFQSGIGFQLKTREMRTPSVVVLNFRTWDVFRWSVDKATLLIHVSKGDLSQKVGIAILPETWTEDAMPKIDAAKLKYILSEAEANPDGWLVVDVPPALAEQLTSSKASGLALKFTGTGILHARESLNFAPYLVLVGGRR